MLARISHGSPCPNSGKYQLRRYGSEFPTEVRCLTQLVIGCNRSDIVHIQRYCSHTTNSTNFYFIGTLVFSLLYRHRCFIDTVALSTPLHYWHPYIIDTLALLTPLHYGHPCIAINNALVLPTFFFIQWAFSKTTFNKCFQEWLIYHCQCSWNILPFKFDIHPRLSLHTE